MEASGPTRYRLKTLGTLALHAGGPEGEVVLSASKSLAVLAYVAAAPGRQARRDHLADLLWPASDPGRARRALRQALYYLSRTSDPDLVLRDDGVLAANPERLSVDLWEMEAALEEGAWERVAALHGGPFLGGFGVEGAREFEGWVESHNERIWTGVKAAYYELVRAAVEAGDPERAVRYGRAYVELNPLDERARRTLIRAHLAGGDRVGAFRAYEEYRALLREELDDGPGEALADRMEKIREELFGGATPRPPDSQIGTTPDADLRPPDDGIVRIDDVPAPARNQEATAAVSGDAPADSARRGIPWVPLGLAAVLVLIVLTYRFVRPGPAAAGHGTWTGATAELAAGTETGESLRISVTDGRAEARASGAGRPTFASERSGLVLTVRRTPSGPGVAVLDGRGDTVLVEDRPADEAPLGWAPDGRRALFWRGERTPGDRRLARRLGILDTRSGETLQVEGVDLGRTRQAAWSPLGTWIALRARGTAERGDLYRVDADGRGLRRLTATGAEEQDPAWSPDGRRLALTVRDSAEGEGDLVVMDADGDHRQRVTHGRTDDHHPVWVSNSHLAFLSDRGGETDAWLLDLQTRRVKRLTEKGNLQWLRAVAVPDAADPVETIRVTSRPDTVSPGQRLRLEVRAVTAAGDTLSSAGLPLRWSTSDPGVLRVEDDGTAEVRRTGPARLVASAGGWTADTLRLASAPLVARDQPPALEEDWAGGLEREKWRPFGEPPPYVTDGDDQGRPAFVNHGDENYDSGASSRRALDATGGLSVEFEARLPFTDRLWQSLRVGLVSDPPEPNVPRPAWDGDPRAVVSFDQEGDLTLQTGRGQAELPSADELARWHTYILQLEPDGRVSWLVDGRLLWRSARPLARDLLTADVHLLLAGRSHDTEIQVGRIRIWTGPRYRLAGGY